jgi:hypothetical protein
VIDPLVAVPLPALLSVVLPVVLFVVVAPVMLIFQSDLFHTHFLIPSPGP